MTPHPSLLPEASSLDAWPHLFVSHGAPDMALSQGPHAKAWEHLGRQLAGLPPPEVLLLVSAHRQSRGWEIHEGGSTHEVHDYGGFDPALKAVTYRTQTDAAWAGRVRHALAQAGLRHEVIAVDQPGMDHGLWVPLSRMWPGSPPARVVLLSMPVQAQAQDVWDAGQALAPLASDGLRLFASGSLTHPLPWIFRGHPRLGSPWHQADDTPAADEWPESRELRTWARERMQAQDRDALLSAHERVPAMRAMHPTPEHWWPLILAGGLASQGGAAWPVPAMWMPGLCLGGLSMDTLAWS